MCVSSCNLRLILPILGMRVYIDPSRSICRESRSGARSPPPPVNNGVNEPSDAGQGRKDKKKRKLFFFSGGYIFFFHADTQERGGKFKMYTKGQQIDNGWWTESSQCFLFDLPHHSLDNNLLVYLSHFIHSLSFVFVLFSISSPSSDPMDGPASALVLLLPLILQDQQLAQ